MTVKCMQNTHEKDQLEWVKNSKFFYKGDASISPHTNLTRSEISKSYENQNQINILTNISIKVGPK